MKKESVVDPAARKQLNRLAREQLKSRILKDVLFDMRVCDIEGWDKTEYIRELQELLNGLLEKEGKA